MEIYDSAEKNVVKMKNRFLRYQYISVWSMFLGAVTWTSLATFMIVTRNEIGLTNIPIFEVVIFIAGLLGVKIAHAKLISLKISILITILMETLFLIVVYSLLLDPVNLAGAGIAVYAIIIFNMLTNELVAENERRYEDKRITTKAGKWGLQKIRKKRSTLRLIGGGIGTSIALVFLTYLKTDLIIFTKVMLVLNVLQNIIDYYLWSKYLK